MTTAPPEPGIYCDVPFGEYLAWPHVNNSSLSYAARSMAHYRYTPQQATTSAMRFGSLVHCGKLEPAAIGARYVVMPDFAADIRRPDGSQYTNVRASKAYKEAVEQWRESIGDKDVVTSDELSTMLGMVQSLTMHDFARATLCGPGPCEVCCVWDDPATGVRCKARADKWANDKPGDTAIYDLKTTRDAGDFERAIYRYSYHRQAAFYADGMAACTGEASVAFGIIAVEKEQPYGVRGALMSDAAMEVGREEYRALLENIARSRSTGEWPSYADPDEWTLPGWAITDTPAELTVNGEVVTL